MDIELNFVNHSNDANNSDIVIFQKNAATDDFPVAWLVIRNCGPGDNHPFNYPVAMAVSAGDRWGNDTPWLPGQDGQMFAVTRAGEGAALAYAGPSADPATVQVRNDLADSAIVARLHKEGRVAAIVAGLAPQQIAAFRLAPTIWIGVAARATEGELLNAGAVADVAEISLIGFVSADIVMTGGGPGPDAPPFTFALANVVIA